MHQAPSSSKCIKDSKKQNHPKNFVTMTDDPKHRKPLSRSANAERSLVVANVLISRLKGDGKAVGLNVDEVALGGVSKA
jgi:hypothetical protein